MNQKGITLVGLLITVIVIVTIAGVCIYTGRDILEEAKLEQLKTNMLLIQAKCQSVGERVTANELEPEDYIGEKVKEEHLTEGKINNYTVDIENNNWYRLSKQDIEEKDYLEGETKKYRVGLGNINLPDNSYYYLVNYNEDGTIEVVYTPGYNGEYTLTEILETDAE